MATIGTFSLAKDGFLQGAIKTLTLDTQATFEPVGGCGISTIEAMCDQRIWVGLSLAATGSKRQRIEKQRSVAQDLAITRTLLGGPR